MITELTYELTHLNGGYFEHLRVDKNVINWPSMPNLPEFDMFLSFHFTVQTLYDGWIECLLHFRRFAGSNHQNGLVNFIWTRLSYYWSSGFQRKTL